MGLRTGKGNRVRWDSKEMLATLSHAITKKELVAGFTALPVAERLGVLCRLADSVALSAEGGSDRAK